MVKHNKILTAIVAFLYGLSILVTIIGNQFLVELLAPITILSIYILMVINLKGLGKHRYSAVFMGIAILCLAIGDTFRFVNHYILNTEPYSQFIRFIYVLPTLFYAINEIVFFGRKLSNRRRDFSYLIVNTFTISMVGFVFIYKLFYKTTGRISNLTEAYYLLFIFIAFFVVMMTIQTFYLVGKENIFKGTMLTTVAMMMYEIMDIHYLYTQALGIEPDSNIGDLLYMLWIFLMTEGMVIQVQKKYYFEFRKIEYTAKTVSVRTALGVAGVVVSVMLKVAGLFSITEASNLIIVMMAYLIMNYLLYTGELNEQQNIILEKKVKEKTKELKKANLKLKKLSSVDVLTGLYNRRFATEFLNQLRTDEKYKAFAMFCIDLNLFKPVNDTYGHEMGDRVLEEFGRRMRELPEEYTAFRTGGDEFLVVMRIDSDEVDLTECAQELNALFRRPVAYETYVFNLSASIGIAVYPEDSRDISELMDYADTAMYDVKNSGHKDGYRFFNKNLVRYVSVQQEIRSKLLTVVPKKDFVLYYQPQVDSITGEIIGVEAFPHLKGEMENVSPAKLIPIAEETGMMSQLGIWIVEAALNQIVKWNETYDKHISLTVNLSPLQLVDEDYAQALMGIVNKLGIPASTLTLDIANSVIMGAASSAKESMKRLRDRGFLLSVNDFGGDDINLSYVYDCGFDGIKLSRALVAADESDDKAKTLINTILAIANELGIDVTAVGIETDEQAKNMADLGITKLQGYKYGKPQKAEELEKRFSELSDRTGERRTA